VGKTLPCYSQLVYFLTKEIQGARANLWTGGKGSKGETLMGTTEQDGRREKKERKEEMESERKLFAPGKRGPPVLKRKMRKKSPPTTASGAAE